MIDISIWKLLIERTKNDIIIDGLLQPLFAFKFQYLFYCQCELLSVSHYFVCRCEKLYTLEIKCSVCFLAPNTRMSNKIPVN